MCVNARVRSYVQLSNVQMTKRHIEFDEGSDVLGPIHGVFDDNRNPSVPYDAAVSAIPLNLQAALYQVM